jgi:hypothetical protein
LAADKHEYTLWGFEEPENSLELANAIEEASAFLSDARSKRRQVFLTSHSPAFFNLEDHAVERFFVQKTPEPTSGRPVSTISRISLLAPANTADLMGELPHLAQISHYLKSAQDRIERVSADRGSFRARMCACAPKRKGVRT